MSSPPCKLLFSNYGLKFGLALDGVLGPVWMGVEVCLICLEFLDFGV